jgi:peptide/nickel transport system substrate-binding protein
MTQAVETTDQAQRRDLYLKIQEILLDDVPAIIIDYPQTAYALNKRLRNVIPNPVSLSYHAQHWWVADGR